MTAQGPQPPFDPAKILLQSNQLVRQTHLNVGQELLVVTEDKVHLCLRQQLESAKAKDAWQAPAGILITIVVTFTTATFNKDFIVSKDAWQAVFLIGAVVTFVWFMASVVKAARAPNQSDLIQTILNDLKKQTSTVTTPPPAMPLPVPVPLPAAPVTTPATQPPPPVLPSTPGPTRSPSVPPPPPSTPTKKGI